MRALQEKNIDVPKQVALVGFDDIANASFTFPPLTTVKQDTQLAGELLVGTLLSLIHDEEVKTTLIPPELVVRKSCGAK
jgi:alanine racemase